MKRVGIDTNVLLRLFVDDDPEQRKIVTNFGSKLNQEYRGVVTLVSLVEMDWALRSQYGFDRRQSMRGNPKSYADQRCGSRMP